MLICSFRKVKTSLGCAIYNGMSSLRETVSVTLGQNNQTTTTRCKTNCL